MTKKARKIVLIVGVPILLLVALAGGGLFRLKSELDTMTPVETGRIIDGVWALRDSIANMYLVRSKTRLVAFDAGNSPDGVRKGLETLGLSPADVAAVFLTHGDADHTGGLPVFAKADVYLPANEEQMIDGRTARMLLFVKNTLTRPHRSIGDGQTVDVDGVSVTAILTPGHTPGSTCYVVDGRHLFTGDSLSLKAGKAGVFSELINMDSEVQSESLRTIARLEGVRNIFTAHHGYTDSFAEAVAHLRR